MDIYLDDLQLPTDAAQDTNLGDLIERVKSRLGSAGAILVSVVCDGLDVTGTGYDEALARPLRSFGRIDLHSADPHVLVTDALGKTEELIDEVDESVKEIADQLTQGMENEALGRLAQCCQSWLQIHQAVCNSVTMLGADAVPAVHDGRTFEQLMSAPLAKLRELKQTIESRDFVSLGDMLNYEMPEVHGTWRCVISSIGTLLPDTSVDTPPLPNGNSGD